MLTATCPHCGFSGSVPPAKQGKAMRCPRCKEPFRVGGNEPLDEPNKVNDPTPEELIPEELPAPWLLFFRLRFVQIRQGARRVLDLLPLGAGAMGQLLTALILSAFFFLTTLLLFWLGGVPPMYAIGSGLMALLTAQLTSAVLVLWSSDEELEQESPRLRVYLKAARFRAAQARLRAAEARQAAEAIRAETLPEVTPAGSEALTVVPAAEGRRQPAIVLPPSRCSYCDQPVSPRAVKCPHCHEYLDESFRPRQPSGKSGAVAAVLSFLIPGLGQVYQGRVLAGFLWFFLHLLGVLFCFFPGIVLHILCIFDAAAGGD